MKRASVTQAKNGLSALLERVRHGETIIIEDRGVPVAQLLPIGGRAGIGDRDRLLRLERQGILRPVAPTGPIRLLVDSPPRPHRPVSLSALVCEERRDGR